MGDSGTKLPPGDARLMARCGEPAAAGDDDRDFIDFIESFAGAHHFGDRTDSSGTAGEGDGDGLGDFFLLHWQLLGMIRRCGV